VAVRRSVLVAGAGLAVVTAVGLQVRRGLGVLRSIDTHAGYWRRRSESSGELLYVALGDSTAQGVGAADPASGYVGRLAADLERESGRSVRVVNLSVTGARAADLVREQLPVLEELRAARPTPSLVTVTIGANDTGRTDPDRFRVDMSAIVAALPPGALVAEVPYFRGTRGADAATFSMVISELVAARGDLVLVPLLKETAGLRPREYAHDLFHPSVVGYDRYYRAFRAAGSIVPAGEQPAG
jgi:acyl-CoA thioesterase I